MVDGKVIGVQYLQGYEAQEVADRYANRARNEGVKGDGK